MQLSPVPRHKQTKASSRAAVVAATRQHQSDVKIKMTLEKYREAAEDAMSYLTMARALNNNSAT